MATPIYLGVNSSQSSLNLLISIIINFISRPLPLLQQVAEVIAEAMTIDLVPLEDTIVPDTLITPEQLAVKVAATRPAFVPLDGKVRYHKNSALNQLAL